MSTSLQTRSDAPPRSASRAPSAGGALAGLSLSILLASLGTSGANVALPTFAKVFGASFAAVQWVVLAYLLAVTTIIVGAGRLGDLVGRRRLLQWGLTLFIGASLLCGLAPSLAVLAVARGVQGLGAAIMIALGMAFVGDAVPSSRAGSAMGLLGTMSAVGTALGPAVGGMLLTWPGWRALFLVNVPLGLVALWFVRRDLPDQRANPAPDRSFDTAGTALLAGALAAFALTLTGGRHHSTPLTMTYFAGAVIGGALFVRRQATARAPLIPPTLLRDADLRVSLAINALVACVMMSTLIIGPFYLTRALGLSAAAMGLTMTVGPIITALAGLPAGRLVDRIGAASATLLGLAAMAMGSVLLAASSTRFGIAGYFGSICFLTVGYALVQPATNTAVLAGAKQAERGVVAGVLSLSRNLGLITGASVMGSVFARASGANDVAASAPDAVARGMRITYAVAATLVVVALVLASSRRGRCLALTDVSSP